MTCHRLAALAATLAAALSGCVHAPLPYDILAAGCPAITASGPVAASRPIYFAATNLPDCRIAAKTLLTAGRGTPVPYETSPKFGGPVRYGIATAPAPMPGKARERPPQLALVDADAWRVRLSGDIKADVMPGTGKPRGRVMLFIHGYNTPPNKAIRRADEIATAANIAGPVIALVWPSQRALAKYTWDEENARWTQPYADALLAELAELSDDVVLVSHSMGNRIAIEALRDLDRTHPGLARHVKTVILASADIDRELFDRDLAASVTAHGRAVTLYVSRRDRALQTSWSVHGAPRIGDASCDYDLDRAKHSIAPRCYASPVAGLSVVDTSEISSAGLGHADFVEAPAARADLCRVLAGVPPQGRTPTTGGAFLLTDAAAIRPDCAEAARRLGSGDNAPVK